MRKSWILTIIAVVVVGMMAGFKLFISEESYDLDQSVGEKLFKMEKETDKRVEDLRKEIKSGRLSQSDCQVELKDVIASIIGNFPHLENREGSYLNVAYNCNIIRKLGGLMKSKKRYKDAELMLRKDNLTLFSDRLFSYCLQVSDNRQEKADYLELTPWAEEIESNLDQEIERYTKRVYAWYAEK